MEAVWQHRLNVLHMYCRLRGLGIPECICRMFCKRYEQVVSVVLYKKRR